MQESRSLRIAALALCLLSIGTRATHSQDLVRSVVVKLDPSGRVLPEEPSPGTGKRYWADLGSQAIVRSNLDGSGTEVVASGLHDPYGLSFDPSAGRFLWTSSADEVVQTLPASGGSPAALQTEFEEPYAIVIAQEAQQVAYLVDGSDVVKLTQSPYSEVETREVLLSFDAATQPVHGLALDEAGGLLYVGDFNGQMTRRIQLADRAVATLTFVDETFPSSLIPVKVAR